MSPKNNKSPNEAETVILPKIAKKDLEARQSVELDKVFDEIGQLPMLSLMAFLQQNIAGCEEAETRANMLFKQACQLTDDPIILIADIIKRIISLFVPLARSQKFLIEGRFQKGKLECKRGRKICGRGLETIQHFIEQKPEAKDDEYILDFCTFFKTYSNILTAIETNIAAEVLGYQGMTDEYLDGLRITIDHYCKAVATASESNNEMMLGIKRTFQELIDRLETRVEFFELRKPSKKPYFLPKGNKVFIIHGHDEAKWRELRDLLEDEFGLKVVVLQEESSQTQTIISKFEKYANECGFAFALLTPDDFIKKEGKEYLQARPNVLFELGWFYGRFGPDRICILKKSDTQIPSDLQGILYIEFQENIGEKFRKIRNELQRVGLLNV